MGNISCCECLWCHKQTRKKYNALIESEFNCNAQLLYRHCWDLCQSAMCIMDGEELMNNLIKTVKYKRLAHGKDTQIPNEVKELLQQMPDNIQKQIHAKIKKL